MLDILKDLNISKYLAKIQILNVEHLKIIAAITMLIDHIGYILFPSAEILRIIGRIAFPIYAFLIGEGCKYSKNKFLYLLKIFITMTIHHIIVYGFTKEYKICVLFGFCLSILLVVCYDWANKSIDKRLVVFLLFAIFSFIITIISQTDYMFISFTIPLLLYIFKDKKYNYLVYFAQLILSGIVFGGPQIYCVFAIIPILMYNGKKSETIKLPKYSLYVFYPLHYFILLAIATIFK